MSHQSLDEQTNGFSLEKKIPVAAGLGGGSADAAATMRLIAGAHELDLEDSRIMSAAQAVGADVPVCVASRPRIMRGVGELLSDPLDLPPLAGMLVNPRVPLSTRDVFGKFVRAQDGNDLGDVARGPGSLIEFLKLHDNDLTPGVAGTIVHFEFISASRRRFRSASWRRR